MQDDAAREAAKSGSKVPSRMMAGMYIINESLFAAGVGSVFPTPGRGLKSLQFGLVEGKFCVGLFMGFPEVKRGTGAPAS